MEPSTSSQLTKDSTGRSVHREKRGCVVMASCTSAYPDHGGTPCCASTDPDGGLLLGVSLCAHVQTYVAEVTAGKGLVEVLQWLS